MLLNDLVERYITKGFMDAQRHYCPFGMGLCEMAPVREQGITNCIYSYVWCQNDLFAVQIKMGIGAAFTGGVASFLIALLQQVRILEYL